jgi:hypothetical protein
MTPAASFARLALACAVALTLEMRAASLAADARFPDWPCVQIKVPEISLAAVWSGPSIDDVGNAWEQDPAVRDLVARLSLRRTPIEDAEAAIAAFVTGPAAEKEHKAKLLFAGLFAALNRERTEVMDGIERFTRRQRDFADKIRADMTSMRALQGDANPDQAGIDELANRIAWETRIFDDRRKTTGYVCEVPVMIDARLFALARAIQQALETP